MADNVTITSNGHRYELLTWREAIEQERRLRGAKAERRFISDFDYIKPDEVHDPRLFRYRGTWFDASEFIAIDPRREFQLNPLLVAGWHGVQSDSFWSATVIRYLDEDHGHYGWIQVGTATW